MSTAGLIVAAGKGSRMGDALPKQYLPLDGRPILRRTVEAFVDHPGIDLVQVVIGAGDQALYDAALGDLDLRPPVQGGEQRQQSVLNGLQSLEGAGVGRVLIHDAARPFVSAALIDATLLALDAHRAALPVLPVVDSVKLMADGCVADDIDRARLARAQTPQGFDFAAILAAHRAQAGAGLSDDAAVARQAGISIHAIPGDEANFKITDAQDLARARGLSEGGGATASPEYRTGGGFDVHRFAEGRPMMLCGIEVPHERGLAGHSDADVGLHAITDAILGALAEGDIGDHFPPADPQWRDAASAHFLAFAAARVAARGGHIASVDLTLICEAPKIKPHRAAMTASVAAILGIAEARVSIKATTTEGLGFAGRGEGVAAQAVATLALPPES